MEANTVGRPMEILLVEDSLMFARLTIGALKKGGVQHRMTWLSDGAEALAFLYQNGKFTRAPRPDLILLDLGLPTIDGREVLSRIKDDDSLRDIPVVVLTASTDQEDKARSEKLNVEGYMAKPLDMEKFLKLIRELKNFWQSGMILPDLSIGG